VCASLLLASWWALLIGIVDASLMILRTALEDRALQAELPGYPETARQVPQRLVPGLW
jgi:protein-S-isoprenylcysteine O-methyltransferase Ste14